jgi:hypothetical protein
MRLTVRHRSRGQVFPLWIVAVLTTLTLSFLALDYGNSVRYQIRAQNAADAAAQALMSIQTQRFNETTMMLYASNVEEFRLRNLLNGILLSLSNSGGCTLTSTTNSVSACNAVASALIPNYIASSNRYTADAGRLNDAASSMSLANWEADARLKLAKLTTYCNSDTTTIPKAGGGDCGPAIPGSGLKYTLNFIGTRNNGINQVGNSTYDVYVPNLGLTMNTNGLNAANENPSVDPGFVDVTACITVPPIIPTFGFLHLTPVQVMGRAGATAVAMTSEWMMPEMVTDTARSPATTFQMKEVYTSPDYTDSVSGNNWYDVDYGGTQWTITPVYYASLNATILRYESFVNNDELSANLEWWSSIPYDPVQIDATPPAPSC